MGAALAALASLVAPGAAAGQSELIGTVAGRPTSVDAYRGRAVWSELSPSGYRLIEYRDGVARHVPIAPANSAFDVDLGPDRHGRDIAVYPRCRSLSGRGRSRPLGKQVGLTPSDIDLRGKVAAVAFLDSIDGGQLRLKRIGGPSRRLSWGSTRDVSIGPRFIHWLALWGDRYYGYYLVLIRYDRRTEFEDRANVPSLTGAAAFARDGDTTYYMARLDPQCADCTWGVYRATDLAL